MADRNIGVTCIEPSPPCLNILFTKINYSSQYQKLVNIFPGKIEDFSFRKHYDCIIAPNLFNLIIEEDLREDIIHKLFHLLSKKGKLILTFFPDHTLTDNIPGSESSKRIGDLEIKKKQFVSLIDHKKYKLNHIEWSFQLKFYDKILKTFTEDFICRYDNYPYVEALLGDFGLEKISAYGDYNETPYSPEKSKQLIIIAKMNH